MWRVKRYRPKWHTSNPELVGARDYHFPGFTEATFAILDRLKAHPHIEQYRKEKPALSAHLTQPFKAYRDDLVVYWVLPSELDLETERNVFSRLLKNDFGAGGCHHHQWLSFYRPGYRRLTDVQLAHSLSTDGLTLNLFVGAYGKAVLKAAKAQTRRATSTFLAHLEPLLQYKLTLEVPVKGQTQRTVYHPPLAELPEAWDRASALWISRLYPRAEVIAAGPALMDQVLAGLRDLWPIYELWTGEHAPTPNPNLP